MVALPAQQIPQGEQNGRLARLPRGAKHEILFVPNEPEHLVHIQTLQRRDAIVLFGLDRASRVEETHGRNGFRYAAARS